MLQLQSGLARLVRSRDLCTYVMCTHTRACCLEKSHLVCRAVMIPNLRGVTSRGLHPVQGGGVLMCVAFQQGKKCVSCFAADVTSLVVVGGGGCLCCVCGAYLFVFECMCAVVCLFLHSLLWLLSSPSSPLFHPLSFTPFLPPFFLLCSLWVPPPLLPVEASCACVLCVCVCVCRGRCDDAIVTRSPSLFAEDATTGCRSAAACDFTLCHGYSLCFHTEMRCGLCRMGCGSILVPACLRVVLPKAPHVYALGLLPRLSQF